MTGLPSGPAFGTRDAYQPPGALGIALLVLLGIAGCLVLVEVGAAAAELASWGDRYPPLVDQPGANYLIDSIGAVWIFALAPTGLVWVIWQERIHRDLWALGATPLRFRPAWAVFWWLLPFVNLVVPPRIVREADVRAAAYRGRRQTPLVAVVVWWVCWVAGSLTLVVGLGLRAAAVDPEIRAESSLDQLANLTRAGDRLAFVGSSLLVVATVLALVLVWRIGSALKGRSIGIPPAPVAAAPPRPSFPARPDGATTRPDAPIGSPG
jgi:hypothetical protein